MSRENNSGYGLRSLSQIGVYSQGTKAHNKQGWGGGGLFVCDPEGALVQVPQMNNYSRGKN